MGEITSIIVKSDPREGKRVISAFNAVEIWLRILHKWMGTDALDSEQTRTMAQAVPIVLVTRPKYFTIIVVLEGDTRTNQPTFWK